MLTYSLLVTGPVYGTQAASSAFQFAQALLARGHNLNSVFFYREGVFNANQLSVPANDEFDLVRAWQKLASEYSIALNVCVAAALRRGVLSDNEAHQQGFACANLQPGFTVTGLGALAEAMLICDRIMQF